MAPHTAYICHTHYHRPVRGHIFILQTGFSSSPGLIYNKKLLSLAIAFLLNILYKSNTDIIDFSF